MWWCLAQKSKIQKGGGKSSSYKEMFLHSLQCRGWYNLSQVDLACNLEKSSQVLDIWSVSGMTHLLYLRPYCTQDRKIQRESVLLINMGHNPVFPVQAPLRNECAFPVHWDFIVHSLFIELEKFWPDRSDPSFFNMLPQWHPKYITWAGWGVSLLSLQDMASCKNSFMAHCDPISHAEHFTRPLNTWTVEKVNWWRTKWSYKTAPSYLDQEKTRVQNVRWWDCSVQLWSYKQSFW